MVARGTGAHQQSPVRQADAQSTCQSMQKTVCCVLYCSCRFALEDALYSVANNTPLAQVQNWLSKQFEVYLAQMPRRQVSNFAF